MFHHESVCLFHLCISIISTVTLNCHGMQYNFRVGGFTMSQKWIVLHANFVPWACEWSFHSTTGKKTGVWLQLTSFALLLNWPAREISHWNSVTVNVHYGNERVVRGTYQWPALVAPLKSNSFLLQECLCSWWREYHALLCLTSHYHRINIEDNDIINITVWWEIHFLPVTGFFAFTINTRITISEQNKLGRSFDHKHNKIGQPQCQLSLKWISRTCGKCQSKLL